MKGNRSVWSRTRPSDLRRGFASRATPEVTVENRPFSLQKPTPMGDMATMCPQRPESASSAASGSKLKIVLTFLHIHHDLYV